jgi:signal transduction histidine kinase
MAGVSVMPCLLIFNEDYERLEFAPSSRDFYPIDNPEYLNRTYLGLDEQMLPCRVARATIERPHSVPVYITDTAHVPDFLYLVHRTRSALCFSLEDGDGLIGVLLLESPDPMAFNDAEVTLAEGIAREIGLAISHRQLITRERYKDTISSTTAWAADLAHDIKSVAGIIGNRASWIKQSSATIEEIRQWADEIMSYATQLEGFGPGGERLGVAPIKINETVQRQVEAKLANPKMQITFNFTPNPSELIIQANPLAFSRVLHHLLSNAVQAMKNQGVLTISIHQIDDQRVEITVQDSGPGINEMIRPSIFQEPVTTKGKGGGYGLVLTRQAVEGMGGKIRLIDSQPGQGAIFSIRLPIKASSPKEEESYADGVIS